LCAAISLQGLLHHQAKLGPFNTEHIITFLDALHDAAVQDRPERPRFVVVWHDVSFHRAALVRNWFTNRHQFKVLYLPPYTPFLNPIEELFSAWRWRIYDRQPHARMPFLLAMEQACADNDLGSIHGWIRHTRQYFPRFLAGENIACDVDEILWPNLYRLQDP
jgi:transposase